jgi:hypothetical protein
MPTEIEFVVETVLKSRGYILARICHPVDFSLTRAATLSGISILPILQQPRALDASGCQRTDLFAFVLRNQSDICHFRQNDTLRLST